MTTTNDQLATLINDYWRVRMVMKSLEKIANNPICGKPGHGFKAARKARKALASWQQPIAEKRQAIERWITRNGKASADERAKRSARVLAELPEYATDWRTQPTIGMQVYGKPQQGHTYAGGDVIAYIDNIQEAN